MSRRSWKASFSSAANTTKKEEGAFRADIMTIAILGRTIALSIPKVDSTKQRCFSVVARKYGVFEEKVRPQWAKRYIL